MVSKIMRQKGFHLVRSDHFPEGWWSKIIDFEGRKIKVEITGISCIPPRQFSDPAILFICDLSGEELLPPKEYATLKALFGFNFINEARERLKTEFSDI